MTTPAVYKAVTGNRLADGEVVFWSRGDWVERFADIELFEEAAVAETALGEARSRPTIIVDPYVIDVRVDEGVPVPVAYRERVRALGPTVHPDMGKQVEGGPVIDAIQHASGVGRSAGRINLIKKR